MGSLPTLSLRDVETAKACVAVFGFLWLLAPLLARRWFQGRASRRRGWDAGLAALGLAALACWTNLGQFNFPGFGHPSETFHYFMGAKYFPEVGHSRLYRCVALAEAEGGRAAEPAGRRVRDLETQRLVPLRAVLAEPDVCSRHFTPERWQAFRADVAWFRDRPTPRSWRRMLTDHGYNATPVWTLFGGLLAGRVPASDASIAMLRALDPALLVLGFGTAAWAFGWRTLCVALLFFGTNYPAQFGWVGGGILRQLELAAMLIGISLLARQRAALGGGFLATAALVRLYPGIALLAPALQVGGEWLRGEGWRLGRQTRRFVLGGLAAALLLLGGAAVHSGVAAWPEFAENSRTLLDTPIRNDTGLRTFLSWHPDRTARQLVDRTLDDPYQRWKEARRATFAERRALFLILAAGFVTLLALAVQRQPLWVAVVLGVGLVPVTAELAGYYSAILAVFALLWSRFPWVGAGLVGLSAAGWGLVECFHFFDSTLSWIGLAAALFALFATLHVYWTGPVADPTPSTEPAPGEG
ncbi:MAG: hypothetical protein VX546_01165 [Myxococcota bacterium]|nr:hypothetical protein [Myxococcota bacterium]